jgi:hypothetical protein
LSAGLFQKFDDIDIGLDIFLVGFPSSIGLRESPQIDSEMPLLRRGIIAGKNLVKRTLVLDCSSFPGNSGGPILAKKKIDAFSDAFHVVGIVTEFVPFRQIWHNEPFGLVNQELSNSGYSIAEPVDTVLDMVWK